MQIEKAPKKAHIFRCSVFRQKLKKKYVKTEVATNEMIGKFTFKCNCEQTKCKYNY